MSVLLEGSTGDHGEGEAQLDWNQGNWKFQAWCWLFYLAAPARVTARFCKFKYFQKFFSPNLSLLPGLKTKMSSFNKCLPDFFFIKIIQIILRCVPCVRPEANLLWRLQHWTV